jgi:hypothetical protein
MLQMSRAQLIKAVAKLGVKLAKEPTCSTNPQPKPKLEHGRKRMHWSH